jgi:hypothetical protein
MLLCDRDEIVEMALDKKLDRLIMVEAAFDEIR